MADDLGGISRIRMDADAAQAITEICRGEPFLFQLAGEQAWYAGTGDVITRSQVLASWKAARAEAVTHVERILERLPKRESDFLRAMADLPANPSDARSTRSKRVGPPNGRDHLTVSYLSSREAMRAR